MNQLTVMLNNGGNNGSQQLQQPNHTSNQNGPQPSQQHQPQPHFFAFQNAQQGTTTLQPTALAIDQSQQFVTFQAPTASTIPGTLMLSNHGHGLLNPNLQAQPTFVPQQSSQGPTIQYIIQQPQQTAQSQLQAIPGQAQFGNVINFSSDCRYLISSFILKV